MAILSKTTRFRLERWIQRGAFHQFAFVATLLVAIAIGGGLVARLATDAFESTFDAIWWSFLRLTDPGYLGDDEGVVLRTVSTVVTVLGYVLFMGSLIAILTQWLSRTLLRLESGLTPITMQDHVVILGWTNRTPEIVLKLLAARGRLTRFLVEHGVRKLRVVVLADRVDAARRLELREHVGKLWSESQVYLRSGSSLEIEDLERLDLRRASVIVLPGSDFELGGTELTDTRVVKTLMSLARILRSVEAGERPLVVAEIFDPLKLAVAERALDGDLEVVAGDVFISRLLSQSVRHPRLAPVFFELLSHRAGNTLYVREYAQFVGTHPIALAPRFPEAVVVGAIRREGNHRVTHLNPPAEFRLQSGDVLVFVAQGYDQCVPSAGGGPSFTPREDAHSTAAVASATKRVLMLGWSYKAVSMLLELTSSTQGSFEVTQVSRTPVAEREKALLVPGIDKERVRVNCVEADYGMLEAMEALEPATYDTIVFLASSWMETSELADARTILGYVLLTSMLEGGEDRPGVLVELLDPANSRLFEDSTDVVLVSPRILSHLLSHIGLRPELNSVYSALFVAGGAEIELRDPAQYGLAGRATTFEELAHEARERGEIALGISTASTGKAHEARLNPLRDEPLTLGEHDAVVVLANQ